MKKILLLFLLMLAVPTIRAQFSLGARASFNMAGQSGSMGLWDDSNYRWIYCFNPGIVASYRFSDLFSLQLETNYANTGSKADITITDETGNLLLDATMKSLFRSIQIPLLARFSFGNDLRYFGEAGPYFDLIVEGKYKLKYQDEVVKGTIKIKEKPDNDTGDNDVIYLDPDMRRKTDLGLYFGAGIEKKAGPGDLVFDVRFGLGFLDIYTIDETDKPQDYKPFRNRMLNVSLAYLFNLGK
jgi:hypothetical protein